MHFQKTTIAGVLMIKGDYVADDRGGFARTFCRDEFELQGLECGVAQCSVSINRLSGTLRGMHFQVSPHEETKLVRVTRGAIYDVALDLRRNSATFCRWFAVELSQENRCMLYIPRGCAHGFQTLRDDTEVAYQISTSYVSGAARGVRWDDPAFHIVWPRPVSAIHPRDAAYPDFDSEEG